MKEILLIRADSSEKINYAIIYNDKNFNIEKQSAQAYEEWTNDPEKHLILTL